MMKRMRWGWIVGLLLVAGLAFGAWSRTQYVVPVLMYHEVDPRPIGASRLIVSPESFARQMAWLGHRRPGGVVVVPLPEVVTAFHTGRRLPSRAIVLTFDDAFENFYTQAWPILRERGFPATLFVVTDWIGRPGYMSWDQIKAVDRSGVVIGSHSVTHPWLPALDEETLRREVVESKRVLEEGLGHPVEMFCYPGGARDERVKRAVQTAGYRGACATNPGPGSSDRDPYAIKRVRISKSADSLATFWFESSGYYTWVKEHRHK